jgi:hypothetical protein
VYFKCGQEGAAASSLWREKDTSPSPPRKQEIFFGVEFLGLVVFDICHDA